MLIEHDAGDIDDKHEDAVHLTTYFFPLMFFSSEKHHHQH